MKRLACSLLIALTLAVPFVALAGDSLPLESELGLQATTFATGVDFPVGLAVLPDGSLLVGTSVSTTSGYYDSTGEIVRLVDADNDGVADQPYDIVATDLPGSITALALAGDLLFVTSTSPGHETISALRLTDDDTGAYAPAGEIAFRFVHALHTTYGLVTRQNPDDPAAWDLVFNIGANGNDRGSSRLVKLSGLIEDKLPDSSIYLATLHDHGESIVFDQPIAVATGIRNTSAMAFHPTTGDLWIAENGIDGLEEPIVSFSADELDIVPADSIGQEALDFGFLSTYTRSDTGAMVGNEGVAPFTVFLPLDGSENEGISSLAFAPPNFPVALLEGVFAGFHGQFDLTGIENEENPLLWIDTETGEHRTVVSNDAPNVGHIDTLVSTNDALFVADMCANGSIGQLDPCGVIYRVTRATDAE